MKGPGLRVWAEIDLDLVRANVGRLKALVGPGVEVIAVAKANAYGHGSPAVVRAALSAGASAVGVGDSTEALELIDAGLRAPILVLGAIIPGEGRRVVENGIQVALHGREGARSLAAAASALGRQARVHLFADTGMGRLGAQPAEVGGLLDEITRTPALRLVGLGTHFSTPGDPEFTRRQIDLFEAVRSEVAARAPGRLLVHAAASAALVLYPGARYGAVRPGLLVHGLDPGGLDVRGMGFLPALSLRTQVVHLKDVPAGTPIGYERTYFTPAPTRIATLPIGYHDGFPLGLSNGGEVLVRGRRARVVGRVSMDYAMVDVGGIEGVEPGDVVTVAGRDGADEIRVEEVARRLGTIPYAFLCGIGPRVSRVYHPEPARLPLSSTPLEASRRP